MATETEEIDVVTRLVVDPAPSAAGIRRIHGQVRGLAAGIERIGAQISRTFQLALGVVAVERVARAGAHLVSNLVEVHTAAETAEIGIAGMFAAMANTSVANTLGPARDVIAGLRKDAAAGAGELQDYADAYQRLLGPVQAVGGSLEDVRELTRLGIGAGFAMRGDQGMQLAALDILQGLQGGLSAAESQVLAPLLAMSGSSLKELNKAAQPEKLQIILRALRQMQPAVDAMGDTWSAQMDTLRDGVRNLVREATAPLFDRWSEHLRDANNWIAANRDHLQEMVEVWGTRLVSVWDTLIDRAGTLAKLTAAAGLTGTTAGAGARLGLLGRMAAPVRGAASAAGGGAGAAGAAGVAGISAGGVLAVGAALGGVALGAYSVASALENHPEMWAELAATGRELAASTRSVTEAFGAFGPMFASGGIMDTVGVKMLDAISLAGKFASKVAEAASGAVRMAAFIARFVTEVIPKAWQALWFNLVDNFDPRVSAREMTRNAKGRAEGVMDAFWGVAADTFPDTFGPPSSAGPGESILDPVLDGAPGESVLDPFLDRIVPPKPPPTNIGTVNVTINVEQASDPSRVAVTMDAVLTNIEKYRAQARRTIRPK